MGLAGFADTMYPDDRVAYEALERSPFPATALEDTFASTPQKGRRKGRVYLIGSLRNERVPQVANELRKDGYEVFDDWHGAGPEADDYWRSYAKARGWTYQEALRGAGAKNVFQFDKSNLDASQAAVLVLPAGKSGHLELGYMAGRGKATFVLFDEKDGQDPERWDVMYQFATGVCLSVNELKEKLIGWT